MISFSGSLKIFLLVDCCDMRKGFNGLYGLVSSSFGDDPRNGALYVFCNRRHSRIKILYFDGTVAWREARFARLNETERRASMLTPEQQAEERRLKARVESAQIEYRHFLAIN